MPIMVEPVQNHAVLVLAAVAAILCGCSDRSGSPDVSEARNTGPATENRLTVDGTFPDSEAMMEPAISYPLRRGADLGYGAGQLRSLQS
jgi:hypothetical protein